MEVRFTFTSLFFLLCNIFEIFGKETTRCEQLNPAQNVELNCGTESRLGKVAYICTYKCKPYFTPHENAVKIVPEHKIHCGTDRKWIDIQKFKAFTCREDCGLRPLTSPTPFIIHGVATNASSWPWHASIYRKFPTQKSKNESWIYVCGGSLIRNSVILTAAHCVTHLNGQLLAAEEFRVALGAQSSEYASIRYQKIVQEFEVKQLYIPSNYDPKDYQGDIALIYLGGPPVRFNDHIIPVCLPNDAALDLNALSTGRKGDVVGFGVDETGNVSRTLKHVELGINSGAECYNSLKRVISIAQFCAGNRINENQWMTVCNGDSGGGFVVPSAVKQRHYIHGIVSTGDLEKARSDRICRKQVVFTRVFQFIFWIRDILERIHGEIIRELLLSTKYPYSLHGSETVLAHFTAIPRQWDNLVTSVSIVYANIDPEILFNSLELNSGLEYLNLSNVRFLNTIGNRRVILPHLKSFILDIPLLDSLKDTKNPDVEGAIGKEPWKFNKEYLKSLLFFDKHEADWPLEKISHLNSNIELTVHISKLLSLNHEKGKFTCQIRFCGQILSHMGQEFSLRHLALSKCQLKIFEILNTNTKIFDRLQSLVLDNLKKVDSDGVSKILKRATQLENFVISGNENLDEIGDNSNNDSTHEDEESGTESGGSLFDEIPDFQQKKLTVVLSDLSKTLKHLSLSSTLLFSKNAIQFESFRAQFPRSATFQYDTDSIHFPGESNRREKPRYRPNSKSNTSKILPANSSISPTNTPTSLANTQLFSTKTPISPTNTQLFPAKNPIFLTNTPTFPTNPPAISLTNLETFVCNLCSLDNSIVSNFEVIFSRVKNLAFVGNQPLNITRILLKLTQLERILFINVEAEGDLDLEASTPSFIGLDAFKYERNSGNSILGQFMITKIKGHWRKIPLRTRAEQLLYKFGTLQNFWTSFEEMESDTRLTSFEKLAYNTGEYKFGIGCPNCEHLPRMPRIPNAIQNTLKSIEVTSAEVIPNVLLDSLNSALELESLILNNVRLLGYLVNFIELPNLRNYRLNAISSSTGFLDQTSSIYGVNFYVPFSQTAIGAQSGIKRFDNIPRREQKLQTFEILFDDCKVLIVDYITGEFTSTPKVGREILPKLVQTNLTKISLRLSETELEKVSIPQMVEELDLRCKSEYEWNCSRVLSEIIEPLTSLRQLRLALHHVYDEHFQRTKFKLSDIKASAPTLEFLGVDEAHIEYLPNIYFRSLKTVLFDTCTYDPIIIQRFTAIFPVSTVGILSYGYDKYGIEKKNEFLRINELIALTALKNPRVMKIVASLWTSQDISNQETTRDPTGDTLELWEFLKLARVPQNRWYEFIVQRNTTGNWIYTFGDKIDATRNNSKELTDLFEMEIRKLRGDQVFGPALCINRLF